MLSRQQQREILRRDAEARRQRDIEDFLLLNKPSDATPTETGVPNNHNRVVRVSESSWNRGLRGKVVGVAPGTESESDGTPTVLCKYADGSQEVRTVSSFRALRTRRARVTQPTVQTTRVEPIRMDNPIFGTNDYLASE